MGFRHRRVDASRQGRASSKGLAQYVAVLVAGAVLVTTLGARLSLFPEDQSDAIDTPRPAASPRASAGPDAADLTSDPKPTKDRPPLDIPESGNGKFQAAPGRSDAVGKGPLITYSVSVEGGLPVDVQTLAATVDGIIGDSRGWTSVVAHSLQRVDWNPTYLIRLASPATTDRLCAPLVTGGRLSCRNGQLVVLNAWRWVNGAATYDGEIVRYRKYLVNHEFGHALGMSHATCPGEELAAPVMVQQTKSLDGCSSNPWPSIS